MSILHRMTDAELPDVLALLAQSGSTARFVASWNHDRMTALVLGAPGHPEAVMPLARCTVHIAPGRSLNAAWLSSNQFAVRMSLRRQTRATASDWPELLPDVDALLVTRRDEASLAARWYAQTGFHDVLAIRCLYLDMSNPPAAQSPGTSRYQPEIVSVAGPSDSWDHARWQPEMVAVYNDAHASAGGARPRSDNFWQPVFANHYYKEHYQFQIIGLWTAASSQQPHPQSKIQNQKSKMILMGYAVVGWSGWHSKRPRMDILELATRQWDSAVAAELLHTTCQLAWSKNVHQVRAVISAHDPYRGLLTRSGFIDRWGYHLLAKWLHPQRYLDTLAQNLPPEIADLSLTLASPGQVPLNLQPRTRSGLAVETAADSDPLNTLMQGKVHRPSAHPALHIEADPRTLTRLLLQRLDIAAALNDGSLFTASRAPLADADVARLSLAFPWTPWIFHMLDYI